jgi:hypothetical protein
MVSKCLCILVFCLTFAFGAFAQTGYVKLNNDSTIYGYIRFRNSHENGAREILIWKTRKDKDPIRFREDELKEYVVQRDTFRLYRDEKTGESRFRQRYENPYKELSRTSFGFGLGLDYGVIGMKFSVLPTNYLALFGAMGYNTREICFNAGVSLRTTPGKVLVPVINAMYGYNSMIIIKGTTSTNGYSQSYVGTSIGFGLEIRPRKRNYFYVGTYFPIHSAEFKNDYDNYQKIYRVKFSEPPVATISIAYHFAL